MENKSTSEAFSWNQIKNGVSRGQRHSALSWLIDYVMRHKYSGDYDPLTLILHWNRLNRPPLGPADIIITYREMQKDYPIPTLSLTEPMIEREEVPIPITSGSWLTEAKLGAAVQKNITHKGRHYEVSSAFNDEGLRMPNANVVIETWLPVYQLKEIVLDLGGEICGKFEWLAPENIGGSEWARQFVKRVREAEQLIVGKLAKLNTRDRLIAWAEIHTLDNHRELFEQYLEQK